MLTTIGGNAIVGPLQATIKHPDPRVRAEVVAALRTADSRIVKPLLLSALPTFDTRLFCQAMQKLGETRDAQVAQTVLLMMVAPEFEQRPAEEKHAIYATLGATGGDEVIPELEAELLKGGWFERINEAHRQTVARCLARIGTPLARMVLENGARSRRQQVRDACADLVARWEGNRG
jgi:HEAT repeat protein